MQIVSHGEWGAVINGIIQYAGQWDAKKYEDVKLLLLTFFRLEPKDVTKALQLYVKEEMFRYHEGWGGLGALRLRVFLEIANESHSYTAEILRELTKFFSPGLLYESAYNNKLVHVMVGLSAFAKTDDLAIMASVEKDGLNLAIAPPAAQSRFDIVRTAYRNNNDSLFFADKELIKALYRHHYYYPDWNLIAKLNNPDILLAASEGISRRFTILKMSTQEVKQRNAELSIKSKEFMQQLHAELIQHNKPSAVNNALSGDVSKLYASELYRRVFSTKLNIPANKVELIRKLCDDHMLMEPERQLLDLRVNAKLPEKYYFESHLDFLRDALRTRPPISEINLIRDYINYLLPLTQKYGKELHKDAQRLAEKTERYLRELQSGPLDKQPAKTQRSTFFYNSGVSLSTINGLIDHAESCLRSDEAYVACQLVAEAQHHTVVLNKTTGINIEPISERIQTFQAECEAWIKNDSSRCTLMLNFLKNLKLDITNTNFKVKDLKGKIKDGIPTGVGELTTLLKDLESIEHVYRKDKHYDLTKNLLLLNLIAIPTHPYIFFSPISSFKSPLN